MHLTLRLSPETEAKLREQAALTGKDPETLILEALQEKLATEPEIACEMPSDEWQEQFEAWLESLPPSSAQADWSRHGIYDE